MANVSASGVERVLVTGGAGYVGARLVPHLLEHRYQVRVLDLYLFGDDVLGAVADHPRLEQMKGDLRDPEVVQTALRGSDAVIHLACISNDPSFELNPALGRSINYDAFRPLVRSSKQAGVRRFIYASSSSVYGVSEAPAGALYVKFLALDPRQKRVEYLEQFLSAIEELAVEQGVQRVIIPVYTRYWTAYSTLLKWGYQVDFTLVRMQHGKQEDYEDPTHLVLDDWR